MSQAELERFREVEEIFYSAIDRPAGVARDALVRERCAGDEGLRVEVTLLLEDHERIRAAVPPPAQRLPRFGAWQAVKLLGRGGMGTVYLAERADGAFHMLAAVKVVPLALASPEIEDRFRRERQFLASLDHPKVARLIDGGVCESGLPYLVMEFVGGLPIDQFCDLHAFDTRARIDIVRQVLDALAYVHNCRVIHRDVKPSNILVDDSGNVKLLDFGTARLVDATAEAALTRTGVFAFTPEYASPEQARGEPATIASDLYSAGVLLYRLLTGRLPYRIANASLAGVAKVIAHTQPDPPRLGAQLDAILAKALSKNAAGRYRSDAEMDADLVRYLEGERVHARTPRLKFWSAAAVVLVSAAAGLSGFAWLRFPQSPQRLIPFDTGVPNPMQPALSSNGKWLAFAAPGDAGTRPDIWLKPMPAGSPQRVTGGGAVNDEPALSPDGRWLAFHSTRPPGGIYLQPAAGGTARLLVKGGRVPRISPDGEWIAYSNTSQDRGDTSASNSSMLYRVPAQGGAPVRLARNALSVQGTAWSADSRRVLFLSTDERGTLRLWNAPLDGGPAALTPEFSEAVNVYGRACALTGDRFLYAAFDAEARALGEFLLKPAFRTQWSSIADAQSQFQISGCTASVNGTVLADEVDYRTDIWVLPVDADDGAVKGRLASMTPLEHSDDSPQLAPDGASILFRTSTGKCFLQDYRTGARQLAPEARYLSTDGRFVLRESQPMTDLTSSIWQVRNLKTGESWGRLQTDGVPWDLSRGGQWVLAASMSVHRAIMVWDTRTAEHLAIYTHPTANLYLASFSKDGRWVVFTLQEGGRPPRMWAAPFRGLQNVPVTQWVDLGEGDYPRWSPGGRRLYFTQAHDGYDCIFTRKVDHATKRPLGPAATVQHFHGQRTVQGLRAGTFRISVAQDKLAFALGERVHRLLILR